MKTSLLKNQNGQGILEYIILTGLIGVICLMAVKTIGGTLKTRINQMNSKVVKEIQIPR
jgi:Flp pilus assembly pilin Flp